MVFVFSAVSFNRYGLCQCSTNAVLCAPLSPSKGLLNSSNGKTSWMDKTQTLLFYTIMRHLFCKHKHPSDQ